MKKSLLFVAILMIFFLCLQAKAEADSWWGDGYREREWVLSHGGTIIEYQIIAKGSDGKYKAILYKNGKVVEWENGKTGKFDDPKDATYVVKAFKGGVKERKTSEGGDEILASGPIVAHPGETIKVIMNELTGEVFVSSDRKSVKIIEKKIEIIQVTESAENNSVSTSSEAADVSKDIGKICVDVSMRDAEKESIDGLNVASLMKISQVLELKK